MDIILLNLTASSIIPSILLKPFRFNVSFWFRFRMFCTKLAAAIFMKNRGFIGIYSFEIVTISSIKPIRGRKTGNVTAALVTLRL